MGNADLIMAKSAEEGIACVKNNSLDLILLDINLPKMDGYQALKQLRQITNNVPVIAVSAAAFPSDIEKGKQAGFDHYITKPFSVKATTETIKSFLFKN